MRRNREEAARIEGGLLHLAAVLPNPVLFRADAPSLYVASRRDWILGQMRGLGGAAYLDELENPTEPPKAGARARLESKHK